MFEQALNIFGPSDFENLSVFRAKIENILSSHTHDEKNKKEQMIDLLFNLDNCEIKNFINSDTQEKILSMKKQDVNSIQQENIFELLVEINNQIQTDDNPEIDDQIQEVLNMMKKGDFVSAIEGMRNASSEIYNFMQDIPAEQNDLSQEKEDPYIELILNEYLNMDYLFTETITHRLFSPVNIIVCSQNLFSNNTSTEIDLFVKSIKDFNKFNIKDNRNTFKSPPQGVRDKIELITDNKNYKDLRPDLSKNISTKKYINYLNNLKNIYDRLILSVENDNNTDSTAAEETVENEDIDKEMIELSMSSLKKCIDIINCTLNKFINFQSNGFTLTYQTGRVFMSEEVL